ncbi:MAG: DUF1772 domain-containing protein [Hyphomicrobium sp.]|nr:DUF1772 domain-containing protein [Hyphomicrobium sp.]
MLTRSDTIFLVAILATSLALGPALAHAFEFPNKIALSRDEYFIVQQIYSGWNRIAFVLLVEIGAIAAIVAIHRHHTPVRNAAALALASVVAAQVVFWIWTFPANTATANWTQKPDNWAQLRTLWEFSHLAGAVLQLIAMTAITVALLRRRSDAP